MTLRNFVGAAERKIACRLSRSRLPLFRKTTGKDDYPFQLDDAGGAFSRIHLAHLRANHFGSSRAASNSPAPVETDRRPENVRSISRFSVDNAPARLRERPCNPTVQQAAREGEPIMAKLNSGRKLGVRPPFKIRRKFTCVPMEKRMDFLIAESYRSNPMPSPESYRRTMRTSFDRMRKIFVIKGHRCYCCQFYAQVRHHVIPLSRGGRNKYNNIVPLCKSCHAKIHPWLATAKGIGVRRGGEGNDAWI